MKQKVYTSINLPEKIKNKLEYCALKLDVNMTDLLSVLCFKAGKFLCSEVQCLKTVEYQDRGEDYEILPVYFYAADHEYIHSCRLSCKISVSKLLSCAMIMFLDEILEKGINQHEIAQLQIIANSYKKKSYHMRNFSLNIRKNEHFENYMMKMRMKKT